MADALDTHQKALALNLDPSKYGAIAEIGAGQEVAHWFFRVGAAAGTVAKTLSAYDMTVSDEIYGHGSRYVARDRLEAMLSIEYGKLVRRIGGQRGRESNFFAFADTMAARNYQGTNICHGWAGVRFQHMPGSEPSTVRLHVALGDATNLLQQQAVGALGINLIHAVFFRRESLAEFLGGVHEGLGLDRVEVDHLELEGEAFEPFGSVDAPLALLRAGLTPAVAYGPPGTTSDPMSTVYKHPLVIERGSFIEPQDVHERLLAAGTAALADEAAECGREPLGLYELTLAGRASDERPVTPLALSDDEVRRRVARLQRSGRPVLVTTFGENHQLTQYLKRYTGEPIRFALGAANLIRIFHEAHYHDLDSGLVEAISRMLSTDVRFYVLPMEVEQVRETLASLGGDPSLWKFPDEGLSTVENTEPTGRIRHLYRYMYELGALVTLPATAPSQESGRVGAALDDLTRAELPGSSV
jgi:hypothetical protein